MSGGHIHLMTGTLLLALFCLAAFAPSVLRAQALVREPNTTLKVPQVPGGFGYQMVDALPGLAFEAPVAIATPPGETNRLFIVEQRGRISVITNLAQPTKTIFLDLVDQTLYGGEQGLLGLAFHPQFDANGRFFIFRTVNATTSVAASQRHDRLSEFRVSATDPNRAATAETILFQQFDQAANHNGGDLHFGPDGYLYVSLGDEGDANDSRNNSQTITRDFFSGLLRLDVDNRPGSRAPNPHPAVVGNYRIPADNPFVDVTSFLNRTVDPATVRTEFWAVGLRNPWRYSFDRATGELWIGDVGQDAWESVTLSRAGANHGWAYLEGRVAGPKNGAAPAGFTSNPAFNYVGPLYVYTHGSGSMRGNSITGGVVYRGARLAALHGDYIFADYVSGNVWSLRRRDGQVPLITRLLGQGGISAFGTDPRNGDVLACDHSGGRIRRLGYNATFTGLPLPPTLADTGAFADLATLTPTAGVVPYSVNLSFWSDGATKRRWFSVPDTNLFLTFNTNGAWGAPAGTVWVKHFDLELTEGVPESLRRLETRFIVRNTNGIHGFTYRWDNASNATLVPEEGGEEEITRVVDGVSVAQTWRYPSRAECLTCHTRQAGQSLSFNTAQLLRDHDFPGVRTNQLQALISAGYFANPPSSLTSLRTVTTPTNESASVEWRARSWLAVNCASCHRVGGTGGGFFDARLATPTEFTGLVDGGLGDTQGDPANRVLVPGDLTHSMAFQRLSRRGPTQMPPLGSGVVDPDGIKIVRRWIEQLALLPVDDLPTLALDPAGDTLRLRVHQPANYAVSLEAAPAVESGAWQSLELPGMEPFFPAESRELTFETPSPAATQFFRVRATAP